MSLYSQILQTSPQSFQLLRDLIHSQTGIYYDENKQDLFLDKLAPTIVEHGFTSFLDYYYLLRYDPLAYVEWEKIFNALSVPETYFFREMPAIEACLSTIIPKHLEERPNEPLHIWCAACATGEEPLTIAMLLDERDWYEKLNIEIWATDASSNAISKAQKNQFRSRSFRAISPAHQAKYFNKIDEFHWQIDKNIHKKISWGIVNLVDQKATAPYRCAHIIFCRNVFIYFDSATIEQVVNQFHVGMPSPGYLFIGVSESLLRLKTPFSLKEINGCFTYIKE